MDSYKLDDMVKGWFIGDFIPSLYKTKNFEIAIKRYDKNDYEGRHIHKIATEYTVIISGRVLMNGKEYKSGDIVMVYPGESVDFQSLENDTVNVVIKIPSTKGDKYLVEDTLTDSSMNPITK